jgi:hypothetical protein
MTRVLIVRLIGKSAEPFSTHRLAQAAEPESYRQPIRRRYDSAMLWRTRSWLNDGSRRSPISARHPR